jgi:hypothetical protein
MGGKTDSFGCLPNSNAFSQVLQRFFQAKLAQMLHRTLAGQRLYFPLQLPVTNLHLGGHAADVEVGIRVIPGDDAIQIADKFLIILHETACGWLGLPQHEGYVLSKGFC